MLWTYFTTLSLHISEGPKYKIGELNEQIKIINPKQPSIVQVRYISAFNIVRIQYSNKKHQCFKRHCGLPYNTAGLRDVEITSGIVAEESVGSVLNGKQYSRGVRLHHYI